MQLDKKEGANQAGCSCGANAHDASTVLCMAGGAGGQVCLLRRQLHQGKFGTGFLPCVFSTGFFCPGQTRTTIVAWQAVQSWGTVWLAQATSGINGAETKTQKAVSTAEGSSATVSSAAPPSFRFGVFENFDCALATSSYADKGGEGGTNSSA